MRPSSGSAGGGEDIARPLAEAPGALAIARSALSLCRRAAAGARRRAPTGWWRAAFSLNSVMVMGSSPSPESTVALLRARAPAGGPVRGDGREIGRLRGVVALVEGHVGDPLQQLCVVLQGPDMTPGHLVRRVAKMLVAERLEPGSASRRSPPSSARRRQRIIVRPGLRRVRPGDHLGLHRSLSSPMNASSGELSQRKIDPIVLFFDLTSRAGYGWRESL